jgi:hypothetical protein
VILDSKAADDAAPKWFIDRLDAILAGEYVTKAMGGDGAMVQAVHDASVHLGAECAVVDDMDDTEAEGKAAALRLRVKALTA